MTTGTAQMTGDARIHRAVARLFFQSLLYRHYSHFNALCLVPKLLQLHWACYSIPRFYTKLNIDTNTTLASDIIVSVDYPLFCTNIILSIIVGV